MLRKRNKHLSSKSPSASASEALRRVGGSGLSRRRFLRESGLTTITGLGAAAMLSGTRIRPSTAQTAPPIPSSSQRVKTICPFCSVGCSIWAEVENGVWTGQEPVFESTLTWVRTARRVQPPVNSRTASVG